jgi:hypothetical protein
MIYLVIGVILLITSIGGLLVSLPVDGRMRAFALHGNDTWIAIAVTTGIGLGISSLIAGFAMLG